MEQRFSGKIALVTGGSRGIGRAIVEELVQGGARVFFTYHRHEEAAEEVASGCNAEKVRCCQTDSAAIHKAVEQIVGTAGGLDILVNNAGITSDQFVMLMPDEEWGRVLDINTGGAFRWVKAAAHPMLTARKGIIVNVASVSGLVGIAGQANYAASKGALLAMTRSLAAELGPRGIRVNAVVPGFIETDMTAKMPRQAKRDSVERILLKRFGSAREVARVVAFLASDESSYIVGQSIIVDGGLTATVA